MQAAVVDAGGAVDLAVTAGLVVGAAPAPVFSPPILVSLTGFAIEPPAPSGQTDAQGRFAARVRMLPHDPAARGRGRHDLRLFVSLRLATSNLVFAERELVAPASFSVRALGALLDTDPLDRPLRQSVTLGHGEQAVLAFSVAKGPDFINDQPVDFSLQGPGSLNRQRGRTSADGTGLVQVVYTAPASGSGRATVAATAADGVVSQSASFSVDFA